MSMIERVAKAIFEADVASTQEDFPDTPESILRLAASALFEKHHIPMARAAIEAMREPTDAMVDSCGNGECAKWARGAWANYIDAALAQQEQAS